MKKDSHKKLNQNRQA